MTNTKASLEGMPLLKNVSKFGVNTGLSHWDLENDQRNTADVKELLHPKQKLSMFCAISQNHQRFFEKKYENL